jgi:uncharacterized protein (TIGR00369 family)
VRDPAEIRDWFNGLGVAQHGYMRCEEIGDGTARVVLEPPRRLAAPSGAMNGGMLASLAEHTVGLAVISRYPVDVWSGAIGLDLQYLDPVMVWPAIGTASVMRSGKRLCFSRLEVHDPEGRLCLQGTAMHTLSSSVGWKAAAG